MKNIGDAAAALLAYQASLRDTPTAATRHALAPASQVLAAVSLPTNTREAYALQDELIRQTGEVAGWKVGGARAPEPNCAPVFASVLWDDATPLPFDIAPETEYECEIAFTFARDLPPRAQPYSETEVAGAIGSTRAAVELLAPRFAPPVNDAERLVSLADGLGCGGLLVGQPVAGFVDVDCAAQPVSVAADGITVLERTGGNLAQRLLPLLCWLANHLAARGLPLRAGQTVTTGSWTGVRPWGSSRHVVADFAGIGQVHVRPGKAA